MSLFSNQNFIHQIAKQCGLTNLDDDVSTMLQVLVEIETRRLIQQAAKFMRNDCRDEIEFQDVQHGMGNLGHGDITLIEQEEQYVRDGSFYVRRDPVFGSAKAFIEEELKALTLNSFAHPKLKARWVYLEGKIPRINENNMLKAKSQILTIRQKQLGEKHKKFNVIMDQPESMLTGYQLDYFKQTTQLLTQDGNNIGKLEKVDLQGNLSNLFPLFLKFFLGTPITQLKMIYFLQLLKNRYINKSAQFHLHQILTYLWAYQGQHCLEVGLRIGSYIGTLGNKYPMLYDIWMQPLDKAALANRQTRKTCYSNAIKKIGIELEAGIRVQISPELLAWMEADILEEGDSKPMAELLRSVIHEYAGRVASLRGYVLAFWVPARDQPGDCYMTMGL